jgi:hypothetical protein
MKTMNKRGPKIDPWGTPVFMSRQLEVELLITCLIVDDPQETAYILNDDLVKLHAWSTKWLVYFNPQKTETITSLEN